MAMDQSTPCLLFLAVHGEPDNPKRARSARSIILGYALFPQAFLQLHPQVLHIFSYNGIHVLTSGEGDPLPCLTVKNDGFEMFELRVRPESPHTESLSSNTINPLVVTVDSEILETIKLILEKNVSVRSAVADEKTSFISEIDDDDLKALGRILTSGTDIYYCHCKYGKILHFAVKRGQDALVKFLLRNGASANAERPDGMTPLHLAAKKGLVEIANCLLQHGGNIDASVSDNELGDVTPLFLALKNRHFEVGALLITSGADLSIKFKNGLTIHDLAMENAADSDGLEFIIKYIENAASLLCRAIYKNRVDLVEMLVQRIPDINKLVLDFYTPRALTPLHVAAEHAGEDIIRILLTRGADINASCDVGYTPMYDAVASGHLSTINFLLANGADARNHPFLYYAASCKSLDIIETLLLSGADVNSGFEDIASPLSIAAFSGDLRVISLLLKYGATISTEIVSPGEVLREARRGGQSGGFQFLLNYFFTDTDLIGCFRKSTPHDIIVWYGDYGGAVARHLLKLESAGFVVFDQDLRSVWLGHGERCREFWRGCEAEVAKMKSTEINGTNISFYNVLVGDINDLTDYARSDVFVESMKASDYAKRFPIYSEILKHQFQKGFERATLVKLNIIILDGLVPGLQNLSLMMKEIMMSYRSNQDLLITAKKMPINSEVFYDNPYLLELLAPE